MNALEELINLADLQEQGLAFIEPGTLRTVVDRIESEWMELPRDMNGEVIHVGDRLVDAGKEGHLKSDYIWTVVGTAARSVFMKKDDDYSITHLASDLLKIYVPDTWERIEADAKKAPCDYYECEDTPCSECVRRAEAGSCSNAQRIDLVRRCKRLAGVDDD